LGEQKVERLVVMMVALKENLSVEMMVELLVEYLVVGTADLMVGNSDKKLVEKSAARLVVLKAQLKVGSMVG
jgi:hypothetical protein